MKKLVTFLVFISILCVSTLAWAPPAGSNVQIRDRNSNNKADVAQAAATIANSLFGLVGLNIQYFYDGTQPRWVVGGQLNTDDIASTTYVPYYGSFNHLWDTVNDDWDRMTGFEIKLSAKDMFALLVYSANMFLVGDTFYDWQGAVLADGLTYPTAPWVLSAMMVDNGATLDTVKSGATGEVLTTDVATRPGEDAGNDRRKISKVYSLGYPPAKQTETGVGTALTTVLDSKEVINWAKCCVYLQNDDGADPFTDMNVDISPDSASWLTINTNSCDALAAGGMCTFCWTDSYRYVRVQVAAADANQVDVDAWITCNQN